MDLATRTDKAIESMRIALTEMHKILGQLADERDPILGPELTLSKRSCEEFRMRLGFTQDKAKGLDPMANKVKD